MLRDRPLRVPVTREGAVREHVVPEGGRSRAPGDRTATDLAALLRAGEFRALFVAHLVSNLGDWLAFLALFGLAALEWQASATRVALLAAAYVLPLGVVAPLAGVLVDRWDLRRVLVASDLARALVVLAMAFTSSYALLLVLLFLHQSLGCFFNPAQSAALPRVVERTRLLAANALTTGAAHVSKLVGPAVAGLLVAGFGPRGCFVADSVSFALSAAWLVTLPRMPAPAREAAENAPPVAGTKRGSGAGGALRAAGSDFYAGWSFLCGARPVRDAVFLLAAMMAALGAFLAVIAVFARDDLGLGVRGMGLLLSTLGSGAIAGALLATRLARRGPKLYAIASGVLLVGLALGFLAICRTPGQGFAGIFVLGVAAAVTLVPAQTLVQETTPRELLGRVTSSAMAAIGLVQGACMALAGPVASRVGVRALLAAGAALLAFTALFWWVRRRPRS